MTMLIDFTGGFLHPTTNRHNGNVLRVVTPIVCHHVVRSIPGHFCEKKSMKGLSERTDKYTIEEYLGYEFG